MRLVQVISDFSDVSEFKIKIFKILGGFDQGL